MKISSRPYKTSGLLVKKNNKFFFEDLFSKKIFKNITFNAKNFFDIQLISCEIQFSNRKYVLKNIVVKHTNSFENLIGEVTKKKFDLKNHYKKKNIEIKSPTQEGRIDLTDLDFITIDGDDAKDFDDAVYCTKEKDRYKLYVAIADVSFYVDEDSYVDKIALANSFSIYLDQSLPMLPNELSDDLCSLKPNVNRLAVICEIVINKCGIVESSKFYESIIQSKRRFTYNEVNIIIKNNFVLADNFTFLLKLLHELSLKLNTERINNGALLFNHSKEFFSAERVIEELMLIANKSVAIFLQSKSKKNSIIFRHHPKSSAEKEKDFESLINVFDFKLEENAFFFEYLDPFLKNFDVNKRKIIGTSFLCFLEKAVYDLMQSSHYALAFEKYLHFTSPIRRYPDLINHRVLKKIVKNETVAKLDPSVTAIINNRENQVEEIHYYYKNLFNLIKFYNTNPINKVLIGIITGVSNFGIFITLRDFDVTGLLHKRNIKILEFQKHKIKILHHGEVVDLRIFDEVSVKIRSLEILNLKVDLSLKK